MQSVNELCEKGNSLSESTIWYGYCKIVYYPANTACYLEELAMGVVKTAIIAPINAAISSNVIKKFSEVSAVNLTDAKKASVTNSNATNNNYFMKVPKC